MFKKERKQIDKLYAGIHRKQNEYLLEFMILTQEYGIDMMNLFKMQASSLSKLSKMTPLPRRAKHNALMEKVEKIGLELSELTHVLAIMELSILLSGPLTVKESARGDYKQYLDGAIKSPFRVNPASTIWDMMNDRKNKTAMKSVIESGIREGKNRLDVIRDLESHLKVDRRFPRWLRSRLTEIRPPRAGNPTGLLSGYRQDKTTAGFAYNAYRMYNTEYARFSATFSTKLSDANPYYSYKRVTLSPFHPKCDACEKASKKRWKPSDNPLPIHPNCLCFYINTVSDSQISRLREDYRKSQETGAKRNDFGKVAALFKGLDVVSAGSFLYGQYNKYME